MHKVVLKALQKSASESFGACIAKNSSQQIYSFSISVHHYLPFSVSEVDFLESTERVTCCLTDDCTGICSEEITTLGQCCSNLLAPVGFSYSLLDQNLTVCTPCPIG